MVWPTLGSRTAKEQEQEQANTLLKDEESAQDNHVVACNFAKHLPI